jgi:DNA-binding transcriptional MerR regulator
VQRSHRKLLKIGELARLTQVSTRTIRFYVEEGLLPEPVKTHRNMAYYDAECIPKIKAIKKAQTERFLPLEVIGRILAENDHDFSLLETKGPQAGVPDLPPKPGRFSEALLKDLHRRRWISARTNDRLPAGERYVAGFFNTCRNMGFRRQALLEAFESIEQLVRQAVQVEFQAFFSRPDHIPAGDLSRFFSEERHALKEFVSQVRDRAIRDALTRHNRTLDSAVLAIGDEGYGIPLSEIEEDLRLLEARVSRRGPETRILIDLATGCSCAGDQQRAMGFLRRALRRDPGNIAARVRWCWYNRFTAGIKPHNRWRERLQGLVEANPGDTAGHVFLAIWYAFDSTEAPDNLGSLQLIHLCLNELKTAEKAANPDLHDWTLTRYAKGLAYTYLLASLGEDEKGAQAFEEILSRRAELDAFYVERMPFFPKWLWPNLLYFYGSAKIQTGDYRTGVAALRQTRAFKVSALFKQRVDTCLRSVEGNLRNTQIQPAARGRKS